MAQRVQEMDARPDIRVWLRQQRESRGWSRRKVSVLLDVDPSTVKRWETPGSSLPDADSMIQLIELFDRPLGFVIGDGEHIAWSVNSPPELQVLTGGRNSKGRSGRYMPSAPRERSAHGVVASPTRPRPIRPHASG